MSAARVAPAPSTSRFAQEIQTRFATLSGAARAFDIRHHEDASAADVLTRLSLPVRGLLERAVAAADEVLSRYDRASPDGPSADELNFELALDEALAREDQGSSKVADLAFMALVELRQRLGQLRAHTPASEAWEMVCDCGSALRRIQKSLGAIEFALCEVEQLPRVLHYDSELETSLQVRRQYRKLWSFAARTGDVQPAGVRNALRGAGTLIAMLIGRDVYCHLRERDRFQLRDLQRRILAWLVEPEADARAGTRLWEDFAGFASMLRQVNLRQELRSHDEEALRITSRTLSQPGPHVGVLGVLKRMVGLDDDLDAALLADPPDLVRAASAVARLLERLGTSTPAPGAPSPSF